jgi:hypothetical protein
MPSLNITVGDHTRDWDFLGSLANRLIHAEGSFSSHLISWPELARD